MLSSQNCLSCPVRNSRFPVPLRREDRGGSVVYREEATPRRRLRDVWFPSSVPAQLIKPELIDATLNDAA